MAHQSKSSSLLPVTLIAGGMYFLVAGFLSGGPDVVGGIIFGVLSLAAAGAILHRRARHARTAAVKDETAKAPFGLFDSTEKSDS